MKLLHTVTGLIASFFAGAVAATAITMDRENPDQPNNKPTYTYVLVHGASGGGWDWKTVDSLLSVKGHKVYRATLTGLGERAHLATPDIDLTTHINDVANLILFEQLEQVILVGHSYGGMVISGVMDLIPETVGRAFFLDAFVPADGMSAVDMWDGFSDYKVVDGMVHFPWLDGDSTVPGDVPQPLKTLIEPVSFSNPEALDLPVTYIPFVESYVKGKVRAQFDPSWKRAKSRGWNIVVLESDHNAQRSHPEELVELLVEVE